MSDSYDLSAVLSGARDRRAAEIGRRGFLGCVGALGLGAVLSACSSSGSSAKSPAGSGSGSSSGTGKTIGVIVPVVNDYVVNLLTGIGSVVYPMGYKVSGFSTNFMAAAEPGDFNKLITQKVAGILVLPTTPDSASRGVLAASQANIPVVNLGWASTTAVDDKYVGRVTLNSIAGAKKIGAYLAQKVTPGEICLIEGLRGNETSDQIKQGVTESVAALGGKWAIVGSEEGGYTRDGATKAIQTLTTSHPNCKIFVDFAAEMGAGVAAWAQRNNRTDLTTISVDGNAEMVPLIKQDMYWTADCYVPSSQSGKVGAQMLTKYLTGKTKTGVVAIDTVMIDKANIDAVMKQTPLNYPEYLAQVKSAIS